MVSTARWQAERSAEIISRRWGEEMAIYHGGSGDTHLLSPVAAEVLHLLQDGPQGIAELTADVAASMRVEIDEPLQAAVAAALQDFETLGIAERLGPA